MNISQIENKIKRLRGINNGLTNQALSNNERVSEDAREKITANTKKINRLQEKLSRIQSENE